MGDILRINNLMQDAVCRLVQILMGHPQHSLDSKLPRNVGKPAAVVIVWMAQEEKV